MKIWLLEPSPRPRAVVMAVGVAGGLSTLWLLNVIRKIHKAREGRYRIPPGVKVIACLGDSFCDVMAGPVPKLPSWGTDVLTERPIILTPGGSALNTAVQLSNIIETMDAHQRNKQSLPPPDVPRVGVRLHTVLGADTFGELLADAVNRRNIELSIPNTMMGLSTGACLCVSSKQDRAFVTYRGAIDKFNETMLDLPLLYETSTHLHIAGYYNYPTLWPALPGILKDCKARGITTSLSPQFDASEKWEGVQELLPHLDVFIPNEIEATAISRRTSAVEASKWFLDRGVNCVVVTLGSKGALAMVKDANGKPIFYDQKPASVSVVDPTGAGDAFAAGFLWWYVLQARGKPEATREALRWGCILGSIAVTKIGASSVPPLDEIQRLCRTTS